MDRTTYKYTYRVGRKLYHREVTDVPPRQELELQGARPGDEPTVDSGAKTQAGALLSQRHQTKPRG